MSSGDENHGRVAFRMLPVAAVYMAVQGTTEYRIFLALPHLLLLASSISSCCKVDEESLNGYLYVHASMYPKRICSRFPCVAVRSHIRTSYLRTYLLGVIGTSACM